MQHLPEAPCWQELLGQHLGQWPSTQLQITSPHMPVIEKSRFLQIGICAMLRIRQESLQSFPGPFGRVEGPTTDVPALASSCCCGDLSAADFKALAVRLFFL